MRGHPALEVLADHVIELQNRFLGGLVVTLNHVALVIVTNRLEFDNQLILLIVVEGEITEYHRNLTFFRHITHLVRSVELHVRLSFKGV